MAITPNSTIRLLKTPFEIDNKNQLTFASKGAQTSYFLSLPYLEEEHCTYQRKNNVIRFPDHVDDLLYYNYVMYKNEASSNKWFYAFVKDLEYINDGRTDLHIETDVIQTWLFDYTVKSSFDSPGNPAIISQAIKAFGFAFLKSFTAFKITSFL